MLPLPPPPVLLVPAVALGLVMGSFATALSYRAPRSQSVAHGRSKCPACGHVLGAADLVPVVSWLVSGGRCRYCKAPISARYPAIEAATALLFVAAVLLVRAPAPLALLLVMTVAMVSLAVIDLEQRRLPNSFLAVLAVLSLVWRWMDDRAFIVAAIAAVIVFAVGIALNAVVRATGRSSGLGMGDAKLLALTALALSPGLLLLFLCLAGVLGVVFGLIWRWGRGEDRFPFGPAILLSYWLVLAAGAPAFQWLTVHWPTTAGRAF